MEIGFLILTDHSEAINGKVYVMGGGWNMLRLPELPYEWGFGIALGLDVSWDETNKRHAMTLHIEGPDGNVLGDHLGMEVESGRPPGIVAGQDQRIVMSVASRMAFQENGPHAVVIKRGDEEIGRTRFYVIETPPGQQQPGQQGPVEPAE